MLLCLSSKLYLLSSCTNHTLPVCHAKIFKQNKETNGIRLDALTLGKFLTAIFIFAELSHIRVLLAAKFYIISKWLIASKF